MTKLGIWRPALSLTWLILMALLTVGAAADQEVDTQGDKELARLTQKIDKTAADGDAGRVTARIVDAWKGTMLKFDVGSAPRGLTLEDLQNLRAKGLGFGDISILLALTAKQPNPATAKSLKYVFALRQAGQGWGKIARDLGYRTLGSVIKSVKATERDVTRLTAERGQKPEKIGGTEKPGKPERSGR